MRGVDVLLEILADEGVRNVFGNPGTTELPLVQALGTKANPGIKYVLALQEATAVGMADGYAQASGRPAFLNLHTSAGLGNAIGNLTNARANGTPLVVTAGQQDLRHIVADPLLSGDLVGLARPVSKWSAELRITGELGTLLRRAFLDSASSPTGPVFLSLPMDLLDADGVDAIPPRSQVVASAVAGGLDVLADLLATTPPGKLALVAGDEVAHHGAETALVGLAEALGCPVLGSPLHGRMVFPPRHPLWAGALPPAAAGIAGRLDAYERVLLVGGQAFMVYPYTAGSPLADGVELLHLAPDAGPVGRSHHVRFGTWGHLRSSIEALTTVVRPLVDGADAAQRMHDAAAQQTAAHASVERTASERGSSSPMHPMAAAHQLLAALPDGIPVVDEAITTGTYVRGFCRSGLPGSYFFNRGGGLGWGMPAALGVSLARDRSPVLCVVGDGSAMYSPQALWTAARERLPVIFAVVDNGQYLILKNALRQRGADEPFVAMDLGDPVINFPALAESMGVPATSVDKASDVADAVAAALDTGRPHLLHLPIATP